MNSSVLKSAISQLHQGPQWKVFTEYRIGSRIADALAINTSLAFMVGYEVKVSRQDFMNDVKHPDKRAPLFKASNEFYYVCPERVISKSQVPEGCGLIEYRDGEMVISLPAPRRVQCERDHLDAALKRLLRVKPQDARASVALALGDFAAREATSGQREKLRRLTEHIASDIAARYWNAAKENAVWYEGIREQYVLPRGYGLAEDCQEVPRPCLYSPAQGVNGNYNLCKANQPTDEWHDWVSIPALRRFVHDVATGWLEEVESALGFSSGDADEAIETLARAKNGKVAHRAD